MRSFPLYSLLLTLPFLAFATPEESVKRINAHLLLGDSRSALDEVQSALSQYPQSKVVLEAHIRALAHTGDEKTMVKAWNNFILLFPEESTKRELLELMAWGIINKASFTPSPQARVIALLAAFFSQDVKGIAVIERLLQDPNSALRKVTVSLAGRLPDAKLCDKMTALFKEEKVWQVQMEVIKAVGTMKIVELRPELESLVASSKTSSEEKTAAIQSLVSLLETAERDYVQGMAQSNRMGLRLLACQVVSYFSLVRDVDLIIALTQDSHAPVRSAAIHTLGFLRPTKEQGFSVANIARQMTRDPDPQTAISAAWLLTLYVPSEGQDALRKWLNHELSDIRSYAAGALTTTSHYGLPLLEETLNQTDDPIVKMNAALGLIGQRHHVDQACDALFSILMKEKCKLAWQDQSGFRYISLSNDSSSDKQSFDNADAQNQIVRLEILNILSSLCPERSLEAVRAFLKEKGWGVSSIAMALLLTEGDDSAITIVGQLLSDPDRNIRIQAALVLALWGRDERAIAALQDAYPSANRDMKERILEGLGRIGSTASIPFLAEALNEPFQILRVIAASSLIQCLNH